MVDVFSNASDSVKQTFVFSALLVFFITQHTARGQSDCVPDGWNKLGDFLYRVETTRKTYDDARVTCQGYGGDLALIKTTESNSFLAGLVGAAGDSNFCPLSYWFGLNDISNDGTLQWLDGSSLNSGLTLWSEGPPYNSEGNGDCAVISPENYKWNVRNCSLEHFFICQRTTVAPDSWSTLNGRSYYVTSGSLTRRYTDARAYCQCLGGDLAVMDTAEINEFVKSLSPDQFWFGLDDLAVEGTFRWVDGRLLSDTSFTDWIHPQPDDHKGREDCAHIWHNRRWNDARCESEMRFACEKDANECLLQGDDYPCDATNGDCTDNDGSYLCTCHSGYELGSDGRTCIDVNECLQQGDNYPCDAINGNCTNNVGSYSCVCNAGYELDVDGKTCNEDCICSVDDHQAAAVNMPAAVPWALFVVSFLINVVLVVIIVISCFRWKGRKSKTPSLETPPKSTKEVSPHYENPSPATQVHTYQELHKRLGEKEEDVYETPSY